jgi:hypothetical protein
MTSPFDSYKSETLALPMALKTDRRHTSTFESNCATAYDLIHASMSVLYDFSMSQLHSLVKRVVVQILNADSAVVDRSRILLSLE